MFQKANDLLASIIENIHVRAKSPIVVSFCISWLIVNWKITLVFLFMNGDILTRVKTIEGYKEYHDYWHLLFIPLIISLIYIIIIPLVNIEIQEFLKEINKKEMEITFLQKELFLEKNSAYENKKRKLQENSNLNLSIDNLRQEITNKDLEIERLHGEISSKNNEIERLLIKIKDYERKQQQILERQHEEFNMTLQRNQNNHQGEIDRMIRERNMMETDFQERMMRERNEMERNFNDNMRRRESSFEDEKEQLRREHSNQIFHWEQELQRKQEKFENDLQRERHNYQQEIDRLNREVEKLSNKEKNFYKNQ